jgi:hypothetical protein
MADPGDTLVLAFFICPDTGSWQKMPQKNYAHDRNAAPEPPGLPDGPGLSKIVPAQVVGVPTHEPFHEGVCHD